MQYDELLYGENYNPLGNSLGKTGTEEMWSPMMAYDPNAGGGMSLGNKLPANAEPLYKNAGGQDQSFPLYNPSAGDTRLYEEAKVSQGLIDSPDQSSGYMDYMKPLMKAGGSLLSNQQQQPTQVQQQPTTGSTGMPNAPIGGGMTSAVGGAFNAGGDAAISSGNPYAMAAGAASKVVGYGLDIYGKYQAEQDARKNYEAQLAEWKRQKLQEQEDRQREIERQGRQEDYFGANYSAALEDRFAEDYKGQRLPGGQ